MAGSTWDDNVRGTNAGSAYVFTRSGTAWSQQARLLAPDGAVNDFFGFSVAVSGDTVVAGGVLLDVGGAGDAGAAHVFVRSGTTWAHQAKLVDPEFAAGDAFASDIALSGDTVAIGSFRDDTVGGPDAGSVSVFRRTGSTWTHTTRLLAPDAAAIDHFGAAVDMDGTAVVVGAQFADHDVADTGAAHVFVPSGTSTWKRLAKLVPNDVAKDDRVGSDVAVHGGTVIVGNVLDDHSSIVDAGSVSAYSADLTPPDTTITSRPAPLSNATSATFTFTSTDPTATFACSFDSAAPTSCTSPITYAELDDGTHTFSVSAVDPESNEDPTPASFTFVVDTAGPVVSFDQGERDVLLNTAIMTVPATGEAMAVTAGVVRVAVSFEDVGPLTPGATTVVEAALACDPERTSCTWSAVPPPTPGLFRLTAWAFDEVGHTTIASGPTVIVLGA